MASVRLRWLVPATALLLAAGVPPASGAVLHDQLGPGGLDAEVNSQNFESSLNAYDDFGADDFVVPAGQVWKVDRVEVRGNRLGNEAASANVFLFADGGTIPGAQIFSQSNVPRGSGQTYPDLDLAISPPLITPGHYWISVQANLDFTGGHDWWWEDYPLQVGQPAAFKQPGDGFGDGCTTFATRYSGGCYPASQGTPDQAFRLSGESAGSAFEVTKVKRKHRGKLKVKVNAPALGALVASSSKLKTVTHQVTQLGTNKFVMRAKANVRKALARGGKVKARINLTMPGPSGERLSTSVKVKLRA
jgi:hypothetical protein